MSVASLHKRHACSLAISCLVNACHGKLLPSLSPGCMFHAAANLVLQLIWLKLVKLLAPDRARQELSRCRYITAWSACLETLPVEEIDIPWAPKQASSSTLGGNGDGDAGAVGQNYLTWSLEYSKHVQVTTDSFANRQ